MKRIRAGVLLAILFLSSFSTLPVRAATTTAVPATTGGITVSPAELHITFSGNETQKNVDLLLTNSYDVPVHLIGEFKGIDENDGLLVPADKADPALAGNLHLSQTDITVPAHDKLPLTVAINKSGNLTPGGHYATLVLTQQTGSNAQSNLKASLSLSLFVIRADGASANVALQSISLNGWLLAAPTSAELTFKNTGNLHAEPHGVITATTQTGQLLAKGIVNEDSRILLPGKVLKDSVIIDSLAASWRPQHVTITVQYQTGHDEAVLQHSVQRWYVPPVFVVFCIAIFALLLIAVRLLVRLVRRHRPAPDKKP